MQDRILSDHNNILFYLNINKYACSITILKHIIIQIHITEFIENIKQVIEDNNKIENNQDATLYSRSHFQVQAYKYLYYNYSDM